MLKLSDYVRAGSLAEAYELNQKKSNVVAGGMMWLRLQNHAKMTLIDLSGLGLDLIEEDGEEFRIGCMCTLRTLETHAALNTYFDGVFKECTRSVVGVQFRNGATVGGSVYGRFGFSDVLTCLLSLNAYVELYKGGIVSLEEFCIMPQERDVLVRIILKKDGRKSAYISQRQTKTDFPVIACGASRWGDTWHLAVGARPARARLVKLPAEGDISQTAKEAVSQLSFTSNLRGSAEYRRYLAEVYLRRLMEQIEKGDS